MSAPTLACDGVAHETGLGPDSYDRLPVATSSFSAGQPRQGRSGLAPSPEGIGVGRDTAAVRAWAKEQDCTFNERGPR